MAIFDLPGAYLNADIAEEKSIILKIEGEFVDIMSEVKSEHRLSACIYNGAKVLYLRLLKVYMVAR